jgi:hypothetical protein
VACKRNEPWTFRNASKLFYSAQILFWGAEFTQVYARRWGSQFRPSRNAVAVKPSAGATAPSQS